MSVKLFHFIICEMSLVSIVSALRSYKNKIITFKVIQYIFHNIRKEWLWSYFTFMIFILSKSIIYNKNKAFKEITVTIIILSPGFCNGFVSEVQFHILSAIKSPVFLVIDSNAFLKWYRCFVTAVKFLLHIQVIGLRIRPAC